MTTFTKEELHQIFKMAPEPAFVFLNCILTDGGKIEPDPLKGKITIMSITHFIAGCAVRVEHRLLEETDLSLDAITAKLGDMEFIKPTMKEMEVLTPLLQLIELLGGEPSVIEQALDLAVATYLTAKDFWVDEIVKLAATVAARVEDV